MKWYFKALKQYTDFSGRSQRAEFWYFALFFIIGWILVFVLEINTGLIGLNILFSLAHIVPAFALFIRRLHDIGKSGWWVLITFIPLIGTIAMTIIGLIDSVEDNKYGQNPKKNMVG